MVYVPRFTRASFWLVNADQSFSEIKLSNGSPTNKPAGVSTRSRLTTRFGARWGSIAR